MKKKLASFFGKPGNFFRDPEKGLSIVITLVIVLFMIKCVSVALTSAFSFDGAVFAQVSQNLANKFQYRTNYVANYGIHYTGRLFDQTITTGLPVTLPVAMLFRLFGESFAAGLIVNSTYLILMAFAIIYYLKKSLKLSNFLVLLAIILLYGTPNLYGYGFGLWGEIPMFFYFLLVLIYLHKHEVTSKSRFLFWAGLFFGVGYLTKTYILICAPALFFAATFDYLVKRQLTLRALAGVKRFFQEYGMFPTGFFVPVLVFELFKLISLGIADYLSWWKDQLYYIMDHGGVQQGLSGINRIFTKFTTHLEILSSFKGIPGPIIVLLLGLLLLAFFYILSYGISLFWMKQRPVESENILFSNDILVLITATLSHFGWWLLITDYTWERYIFIGYILLEIWLVVLFSLLAKYTQKFISKTRKTSYVLYRLFYVGFICLLLVGSSLNIINKKEYLISFEDTAEKTAILKAGQYIRNLPDSAEVFGYGWWQAPVVAFASGKTFENIFNHSEMMNFGPLTEKYFVIDLYAFLLDPTVRQNILDQYDNQLVFSQEQAKIYIYKLKNRAGNPPVK